MLIVFIPLTADAEVASLCYPETLNPATELSVIFGDFNDVTLHYITKVPPVCQVCYLRDHYQGENTVSPVQV